MLLKQRHLFTTYPITSSSFVYTKIYTQINKLSLWSLTFGILPKLNNNVYTRQPFVYSGQNLMTQMSPIMTWLQKHLALCISISHFLIRDRCSVNREMPLYIGPKHDFEICRINNLWITFSGSILTETLWKTRFICFKVLHNDTQRDGPNLDPDLLKSVCPTLNPRNGLYKLRILLIFLYIYDPHYPGIWIYYYHKYHSLRYYSIAILFVCTSLIVLDFRVGSDTLFFPGNHTAQPLTNTVLIYVYPYEPHYLWARDGVG